MILYIKFWLNRWNLTAWLPSKNLKTLIFSLSVPIYFFFFFSLRPPLRTTSIFLVIDQTRCPYYPVEARGPDPTSSDRWSGTDPKERRGGVRICRNCGEWHVQLWNSGKFPERRSQTLRRPGRHLMPNWNRSRSDKKQRRHREKMEAVKSLDDMPSDVVSKVLAFTTPADAGRSSAVSRLFRAASSSDELWKRFLPSNIDEILPRAVAPIEFSSKKELFSRLCDPILIDGGNKVIVSL